MTTPILVFDIETIPDIENSQRLYNLQDLSMEDTYSAVCTMRREKTGNDFLPLYLQKIVAISLVLFQRETIKVWSLGEEDSGEAELIHRFFKGVEKHKPVLVSWNGCGFDLPVLHYRALLHGVPAPIYWEIGKQHANFRYNNYLNRFHYRHLDLMDILASYQNKAFAPLDEIAIMLGFPGKLGMKGSEVWGAFQNGEISAIRNYCETDVLNTFCIYLRFELMRGIITREDYDSHLHDLYKYLIEETNKPHLKEFAQMLPKLNFEQ